MKRYLSFVVIALLLASCGSDHFISNKEYRLKVNKRFEERKQFAQHRNAQLFDVFNQNITTEEQEALMFLYAYMPLCDLADYNGDFFLKQVRFAFNARETFSWGKEIPEEVFRHFVLPYRVNNENLDSARWVFYGELKDRVKGLSMKDAALEVNHWCHEKVNYQPADERTSSPLSTVRTSFGRCGEESTFTVTALRSVGIPARQVYTPRWAHCDDNHAWVEVWIDGKWSYLGACEPESDLNIAWFTEPARRAMLVHTKVFGDYTGSDEVVKKSDNFTEINVVGNYAKVKPIFIKVVDGKNSLVENAKVDFGLYNYAEFYPIATKYTDSKGLASLTTGLGDLLIWASKGGEYGSMKISVGTSDTVVVALHAHSPSSLIVDYDLVPPMENTPLPVNAKAKEENQKRFAYEDSLRAGYRSTFIDSLSTVEIAAKLNLDKAKVYKLFKASMGNWQEIKAFLLTSDSSYRTFVLPLLETIAEKDLRDTRAEILNSHLYNASAAYNSDAYDRELFISSVLNPRIKNENLIAYRKPLHDAFAGMVKGDREQTTNELVTWIKSNITIADDENYYNLPLTPVGVYELRVSNRESRNIFFVAVGRSLGIPSRLEPASKVAQYHNGKQWLNVYFEEQVQQQPDKGFLVLDKSHIAKGFDPAYIIHFTIGKLVDGVYKTLDYGDETKLSAFPGKLELEVGSYRIITGMRGSNGTVYAKLTHFEVTKGKAITVPLEFREPTAQQTVIATLPADIRLFRENGAEATITQLMLGKDAAMVAFMEPGKEPTKHLVESIRAAKAQFGKWNGRIILVTTNMQTLKALEKDIAGGFPANCSLLIDKDGQALASIKAALEMTGRVEMPLVVVANAKGEILLTSTGYKIGLSEQILKIDCKRLSCSQ